MCTNINTLIQRTIDLNVHTNLFGLARSILAFTLLITLLFNPVEVLFSGSLAYEARIVPGIHQYSIFHLFRNDLWLAKWISILVLLIVGSGWRPRWTGLLHWWIAFSFFASCPIVDGGDQIGAILSFYFIPFTLSDTRKWHWSARLRKPNYYINGLNHFFLISIRVQASVIYFFAAAEKLAVAEWKNGTVIYYWLNHSTFGMNEGLRFLVDPIIESPFVALITWSVLILEVLLAMALLAPARFRSKLFPLGIGFHFLILIFHGLFTFFFYMTALLILYLYPNRKSLNLQFAQLVRGSKLVRFSSLADR